MEKIIFREVQPILPSQDVGKSIAYYVDKLGFTLMFRDKVKNPTYAGVRRGNIELHLQWHDSKEWGSVERPSLRFQIDNISSLFKEYSSQDIFHQSTTLKKTPWGTYEFAFYDLDMNGLTFYEDLKA